MTSAFKEFEHTAWQNAVDQYDAAFSRLTEQVIPAILAILQVRDGTALLDVACGPGNLAVAAEQRGAKATGMDFSAHMVARAKNLHPALTFYEGDAENLSGFADDSFDAVAMNFGMLHLDQPENALKATYRVLKPGGRMAFTVWAPQDQVAGFAIPLTAMTTHGDPDVKLPPGPSFFQFSQHAACADAFARCGFVNAASKTVEQFWDFNSAEDFFEAIFHGTARTGGLLKRQPPERLAKIRADIIQSAQNYSRDGKIVLPMPAHLAWAIKP